MNVTIAFILDIQSASATWVESIINHTVAMLNNHTDGWHDDDVFADGTFIQWKLEHAKCDSIQAAKVYWDIRHDLGDHPPNGVIGARCSDSSLTLALLTGLEQVPQVSHASTTPKLSDDANYPFFSRLVAPDDARGQGGAIVALLDYFGWDRVGILLTDLEYSRDLSAAFQSIFTGDVAYTKEVPVNSTSNYIMDNSVEDVLNSIPTDDPRINSRVVILIAHEQHAYDILREARNMGFQSDTIWIGVAAWVGRSPDDFDATNFQEGYIGVTPYRNRNPDYYQYLQLLNSARSAVGESVLEELPDYSAETMVDSILSLCLAFSTLQPAQRENGYLVTSHLRNLSFNGVSGEVSFTEEGDRADPVFSIFNAQIDSGTGMLNWVDIGTVGINGNQSDEIRTIDISKICFPGVGCGLSQAPSDSYPVPDPLAPLWVLIIVPLSLVLVLIFAFRHFRTTKTYKQKMLELINGIDDKIATAREERERLIKGQFEQPKHWVSVPEKQILVEVTPIDDEYWTVRECLRKDMRDAHISRLWRIQNRSLWAFYTFHKDRLTMNGIDTNEAEVWHGTSQLDPDSIYNDRQDGFMMQFARMGFWGRGIYFAEKSSYSHSYAYKPCSEHWQPTFSDRPIGHDGEREMFLAKLLVGKAIYLKDKDQSLVVPPEEKKGSRYNTVKAQTGGSDVYIVYENGRAYPNYLVRYYTGRRDEKRTPFESSNEARKSVTLTAVSTTSTDNNTNDVDNLDANNMPFVWQFAEGNSWIEYDDQNQIILEKAYKRRDQTVLIQTSNWQYEVDLTNMIQKNIQHPNHTERQVWRRAKMSA